MTRFAMRWILGVPSQAPQHREIPHLSDLHLSDLHLSDLRWVDRASITDRRSAQSLRDSDSFELEQTESIGPAPGGLLAMALSHLDPRTRHIVTALHLLDQPLTPEALASLHHLTPDQIRTLDTSAFAAVQRWMRLHVTDRRDAARQSRIARSSQ
jgi:hypothetical protein